MLPRCSPVLPFTHLLGLEAESSRKTYLPTFERPFPAASLITIKVIFNIVSQASVSFQMYITIHALRVIYLASVRRI